MCVGTGVSTVLEVNVVRKVQRSSNIISVHVC